MKTLFIELPHIHHIKHEPCHTFTVRIDAVESIREFSKEVTRVEALSCRFDVGLPYEEVLALFEKTLNSESTLIQRYPT